MHIELREAHGGADWIESYAYSDGGGNVVQTVTEAEPEPTSPPTPRWIASGRVEIDNKGSKGSAPSIHRPGPTQSPAAGWA